MTSPVLSASQLELFKLCQKRWGFVYLDGRREPQAESATAGTIVHDRIEKHLIGEKRVDSEEIWTAPSGKIYEIGKIAEAMLKNIPWGFGELTKEQVETKLKLIVDDIEYTGRVDLRFDEAVIQIWDEKTTSDLRYAKTEEQLEEDVQALMYAQWGFSTSNADEIDLVWNYGTTKGKQKTRKVQLRVLRDETQVKFAKIVTPLARKVLAAYSHRDKKRLRQNTDACNKFPPRGCPFRAECVDKELSMSKMNLLDMLKAEEETVAPEVAQAVKSDIAAIAAIQAADPINAPESQIRMVQVPVLPINPEHEKLTDELVKAAELPKKARKKKLTPEQRELTTSETIVANTLIESGALVQTASYTTPAEILDPKTPPSDPGTVALEALEQKGYDRGYRAALLNKELESANDDKPQVSPSEDKPIRTLFVGCIPLNKQVKYAHEFIARASQIVENDLEIHHVLLAPYSTGGASLAAQLRADILASDESDFDLVLMNRSPEGRAVEQVLVSLAKNVVVGV